jgi:hypothetical protein
MLVPPPPPPLPQEEEVVEEPEVEEREYGRPRVVACDTILSCMDGAAVTQFTVSVMCILKAVCVNFGCQILSM